MQSLIEIKVRSLESIEFNLNKDLWNQNRDNIYVKIK